MKEKNKEPLFHIVKRDALPWYKSLGIRFLAILLALILCGIITTITTDRKSTRLNSSHNRESRMPSSA